MMKNPQQAELIHDSMSSTELQLYSCNKNFVLVAYYENYKNYLLWKFDAILCISKDHIAIHTIFYFKLYRGGS